MSYQKFKERIREEIKQTELPLTKKPQKLKSVILPEDISNLSDKQLGYYLTIFTVALDYAESVLARACMEESYFQEKLDILGAKFDISYRGSLKTAHKRMDKTLKSFRYRVLVISARIRILETIFNRYDRGYRAISREISRREKTAPPYSRKIR